MFSKINIYAVSLLGTLVVLFGVLSAVFLKGKAVQKANQNATILKDVAKRRQIDEETAALSGVELRERVYKYARD